MGVAEIKSAFGLGNRDMAPGERVNWLPRLLTVARPEVYRWVLYDEVFSKLKIRRIFKRAPRAGDRVMALIADLVREAKQAGEQPSLAAIGKWVTTFVALSELSGSTRELCDRFGFSRASANTYRRELVARGFPPGVGLEPQSQRLLSEWIGAVRAVVGDRVPPKPTIPDHVRERMTISAPWLLEHDVARSVEGISVDDGSMDPIIVEVLEALAG